MGVFDTWAEYIVEVLKAESSYSGALVTHGTLLGDARETIVKGVLKRILPPAFEVGRGQVIDSDGKASKQIDIIIARSDSPALVLPSGDKLYLVESVLATIEVKSTLSKKELLLALSNCASIADLNPRVHGPTKRALMSSQGITKNEQGDFQHDDPLVFQRWSLKSYPATYIFGFEGYPSSLVDFYTAVGEWMEARENAGKQLLLRHLPAVIATEGCYGCRNETPFNAIPNPPVDASGAPIAPAHYLFGKETIPLKLMIAHLLATLFAKIPWEPDIEGLRMEPRRYIEQITLPAYDEGFNLGNPSAPTGGPASPAPASPTPAPTGSAPAPAQTNSAAADSSQTPADDKPSPD